jgi:glutamate racemase
MTTPNHDAPLLFFDSGIGGLSVLVKVRKALPNAPFVYAADFAGLPYGTKSEEEIAARVPALLGRLVERYRPRLVTIACNTACTIALSHVRAALNVPVVGTVPAIKSAAEATKTGVIGLLGTAATIRQRYVDHLQDEHAKGMTLLRHAAPELVEAAEAKMRGEATVPAVFKAAMAALTSQAGGEKIDVVVLGCTHFPLVQSELSLAAPAMKFVDGSDGIARRISTLTAGQSWPEREPEGQFVATGAKEAIEHYKPELAKFGFTSFDNL